MTNFKTKDILILMLVSGLIVSIFGTQSAARVNALTWRSADQAASKIHPAVRDSLAGLQQDDSITVILTLGQQADVSKIHGKDRAERQKNLIQTLKSVARNTQEPIQTLLQNRKQQGRVSKFSPLWIINGFSVTATADVIAELAQDPSVASITPDDLEIIPAYATPEINVAVVQAPALWDMGYTGQGIVVASMDTGVDVNHPELLTRWRGGNNSWFDPYGQHPASPIDLNGHGTWTMGVMVGGDAGGTTIGMAPGAQWIAVRIFDDTGGGTATAVHQGYQWLLDPDGNPNTDDAPHVVNNSWTLNSAGCNLDFEPDLQALRAAGILPVFAAGNYGPSSNTSRSPANNPSAFPVGNVNDNKAIYSSSSRGPSSCPDWTGPYPRIVAPGVTIRTTDLFGGYYNPTGTSLAAPHVSGALVLLLSAFPNLSVEQQQSVLINSAVDLGVAGPDNSYGYGRLDLLAAFSLLTAGATPTSTSTSLPSETATSPGATSTNTFTPSATYTFTPLPISTGTPTALPSHTNTPTLTSIPPTSTFTITPAPISTKRPTRTLTATSASP